MALARATVAAVAAARRVTPAVQAATRNIHVSKAAAAISVEFPGVEQARASDKYVNIIFVNYKGERSTLRAEIGKTLAHAVVDNKWPWMDARAAGVTSKAFAYNPEGEWFEPTFGEGPMSSATHVIIPQDRFHLCPPMQGAEASRLAEYPFKEDMTETSRLADQVTVVKGMDGMVVYVPDPEDTDVSGGKLPNHLA
ncbi:Fdx2 [Symbiodinium sp. KB8]|nr:Fdx2 [Symbiodinium sp. KB8]